MKPRQSPNLEPLVASLLARAPKMNFMQLCRLLEVRVPDQPGFGTRDTPEHEPVRFRPRPRLGFPAGEIAAVEFDHGLDTFGPDAPPTVRTTFMGLYGVDAAMPSHIVDEIVLREEGHEAVAAFLDQFNHRYVTLLYRAWKKYRYPESFRAGGADAQSRNLLCLAGFGWGGKPARSGLPDSRVLALLGLMVQRTRTPEGLAGVVALAAPGVEVRVDEFWPTARRAGQPQPLTSSGRLAGSLPQGHLLRPTEVPAGQGAGELPSANGNSTGTDHTRQDSKRRGLGGGYVLGTRLEYRSRAVRVTLGPSDGQQAHDLLPGAWLHRELMAFIRLYVGTKADVHLRMEVSSRLAPAPSVGAAAAALAPRLGWTIVLPSAEERVITIALGVYEAFPTPGPNPHLLPRAA